MKIEGLEDNALKQLQSEPASPQFIDRLRMADVADSIVDKTAQWLVRNDEEMYKKESLGSLGTRDLRPNTDRAPHEGKLPNCLFVVALDQGHKPIDVLKYINLGTGARYQGQYQFSYQTLTDGSERHRINVYNWVDAEQNKYRLSGPQEFIGKRLNTLAGVSQYYYDSSGKCLQALYFSGTTFLNKDRSQWKPIVDMKIENGKAAGTVEERWTASKIDFFNLLGPRLPEGD